MPVIRGRGGTGLLTALSARKKPKGRSAVATQKQADAGGRYLRAQHERVLPTPGTSHAEQELARIRAAGRQAAREQQRLEAFHARRLKVTRALEERVNAGKMTPGQAHAKLQAAGFIPGGSAFKEAKGVGGYAARTVADVATNAVYAPAGIYHAGKAVAEDVSDTARGHPTLKRTAGVGKQVALGVKSDLEHPGRHPGNVALDVFGVASAGAGLGVRGVSAAGELGAGSSALARAGRAGRALASKPKPLRRTVTLNDLEVHPVASTNPLMRAAQELHDRALSQGRRVSAPRGTAQKRAGFELKQEGRVLDAAANAEAAALHKAGSKGRVTHTAEWRARQMAMRLQAVGTTADERVAMHEQRIAELGNSPAARMEKARHRANIDDINAAREFVDESSGKPVITDPELAHLYARTAKLAGSRDELLGRIGLVPEEALRSRVQAEGRVVKGARYEAPTPGKLGRPSQSLLKARARVTRLEALHERALERAGAKAVPYGNVHTRTGYRAQDLTTAPEAALKRQHVEVRPGPKTPGLPSDLPARGVTTSPTVQRLGSALSVARDELARAEAAAAARVKPTGLVGQEDFTGGEFRVPSQSKRPPKGGGSGAGSGGTVAYPQAPGSVTHSYTGSNVLHATERNDVARLVAESALEANKYQAVMRLRDRIVKAAVPVPANLDDYLPVRLDQLKSGKLPQLVKDAQTLPEGAARSAIEQANATTRMQGFWDQVFPPHPAKLTPEAQAAFQKLAEQGKIGWVHKDLLRQVRTPSLLAPARAYIAEGPTALRVAAGVVPAINRASKAAILYLKPAYAIPNMLGNAALAIVHQGFAAPVNLARAAKLNSEIGPEALAALDGSVGEGMTAALHDAATNLGARAVNAAADVWSKGVDTPFRRAAFIHEARRYGYRTPNQLHALLTDAKHQADLNEVAQRANRALIDYGRLGPLERELVRHVVFFYPWVKGSTMYAGHFVTEHPAQAAVVSELGEQGHERALHDLGVGPSYTEGTFRVGGTAERPTVVNPSGAAILTTPAQVAQMVTAAFSQHPEAAATSLLEMLTPALSAGLAGFGTHRDPLTGVPLTGSSVEQAAGQLTKGLPQVLLYQRLHANPAEQQGRLYPTDQLTALLQFILGSSVTPRTLNRAKFNQLGQKQAGAGATETVPSDAPTTTRSRGRVPYRGSVYAQHGSSGGSVYAQHGSSRGSVYAHRGGRVPYRP